MAPQLRQMPMFLLTAQAKSKMRSMPPIGLAAPGYTFWGGREGYGSLINTDMKREVDHLAGLSSYGSRLR